MIRITKPATGPRILTGETNRGPKASKELRDRFDAGDREFNSKDFKSSIYGSKSVKNALLKHQHGKCAFCESKFTHVAYGDVEHFRPKAGYRQKATDDLVKPGYYWLAYDWDNLLASCQLCNQRFKKNLFPLLDESTRAKSHNDDVSREDAALIHPATEEPADFIGFREEIAYPINGSTRARDTIKALGLDRNELEEARRTSLRAVKLAARAVEVLRASAASNAGNLPDAEAKLLAESERFLEESVHPSAEHSHMAACYLAA